MSGKPSGLLAFADIEVLFALRKPIFDRYIATIKPRKKFIYTLSLYKVRQYRY